MSYKNFGIQTILRLLLITAGLFALLYYSYIELNYIRIFFIIVFLIIVLLELFSYLNRANKDTSNFLQAIIHNDFTIKYSSESRGKSYRELYDTFNLVNQKFLEVSQKEATEYQYLNELVQQLKIGILSIDTKDRISLANDSIKSLLNKQELINLESVRRTSEMLYDTIKRLKNGESDVIKVTMSGKVFQLSINVSEFKLRNDNFKLVSVQDIRGELDENEMLAWQKLIRVLTHEIMNSVAPITSLSGTLNQIVASSKRSGQNMSDHELDTLCDGLDAIENRSKGLMNFTEAYRSLTRIPLPNLKPVDGQLYFQRIISLFTPTLNETDISFAHHLPSGDFTLEIDPDLMEQAIINLLKNAKEAIVQSKTKNGKITLNVTFNNQSQYTFSITDNGGGISEEVADKIFIPFYTTKDSGSGVGLSLVKQITQLHKGQIELNTDLKKGSTEFVLIL